MNIQFLDGMDNPVNSLNTFKKTTVPSGQGISSIRVRDKDGVDHLLRINPSYMGGGFAYFLTHTGMGRQQMIGTTLEDLVKEGGIIDTFLKEAGATSGGRRKSRKAKRKTRKTRRRNI